jgi:hypothetical protein
VKEDTAAAKKSGSGLLSYFQSINDPKRKGTVDFSFGNIFSCLLFTHDDDKDTKRELMMIADKLDKIEKTLHINPADREKEELFKFNYFPYLKVPSGQIGLDLRESVTIGQALKRTLTAIGF